MSQRRADRVGCGETVLVSRCEDRVGRGETVLANPRIRESADPRIWDCEDRVGREDLEYFFKKRWRTLQLANFCV